LRTYCRYVGLPTGIHVLDLDLLDLVRYLGTGTSYVGLHVVESTFSRHVYLARYMNHRYKYINVDLLHVVLLSR
jgi:hypothetical protein